MSNNDSFILSNKIDNSELSLSQDIGVRRYTGDDGIEDIFLPRRSVDGSKVTIKSESHGETYFNFPSIHGLAPRVKIKEGSEYFAEYHESINQWIISGEDINSLTSESGNKIPDNLQGITYYSIDKHNDTSEIILPPTAEEGAVIVIRSSVEGETKIFSENKLHPNIGTIKPGEQFVFTYQDYGKVWFVEPASFQIYDKNNIHEKDSNTPFVKNNDIPLEISVVNEVISKSLSTHLNQRVSNSLISGHDEIKRLENNKNKVVTVPPNRLVDKENNILITSPNDLGSHELPSGYDKIEFKLSDGNWVKNIELPQQVTDKNKIVIKSDAQFNSYLRLPFAVIKIENGSEYTLEYHENTQQWDIRGPGVKVLTAENLANVIPSYGMLTYYIVDDSVPEVALPDIAEDGTLLIVQSTAVNDSKISTDNFLFPSTTTLKNNDQYVFKYISKFNKWVIESAPNREVGINNKGEISHRTTPITQIVISDDNWQKKIKLPKVAGDRDKIILTSLTDSATLIETAHVNNPSIMELHKGEQYEFFYIADKGGWQLMSAPDTLYQADDITNDKIPSLHTPRTIIDIAKNENISKLTLPNNQVTGSRIIINNGADNEIPVWAGDIKNNILKDEIVAFKVDEQQIWQRETITIDLLLLYSDKAAVESAEETIQKLLIDNLDYTNNALENSGANFRYRSVGMRQVKAKDWTDLHQPLYELLNYSEVKQWRDELGADGIYYIGNDGGPCGVGFLGAGKDNMIGVGASNCGNDTMSHELGHNMGQQHNNESNSYNQGYAPVGTIMVNEAIPYYSTPDRYTIDYGIAMGIPDKADSVRSMNERSAIVAAYRETINQQAPSKPDIAKKESVSQLRHVKTQIPDTDIKMNHEDSYSSDNQGYELLASIMAGNDSPYNSILERHTSGYGMALGIPIVLM